MSAGEDPGVGTGATGSRRYPHPLPPPPATPGPSLVERLRRRPPQELLAIVLAEARGTLRDGRASGRHPEGDARGHDGYQPSRYRTIERALEQLDPPAGQQRGAFLDVGCGKGRALLVALRRGFPRVVGVEVDPDLVDAARTAVAGTSAEVRLEDATSSPVDDDVTAVYLFNPFPGPQTAELACRLRESLDRRDRWMRVAYVNPLWPEPFQHLGFTVVHRAHDLTVFEHVPDGGSGPSGSAARG